MPAQIADVFAVNAHASHPHPPVIITIDGPAGTGKSTVAHLLAKRLGLEFLDTGAMYRAAALVAIEQGIDPTDGRALADALQHADLRPSPTSLSRCEINHRGNRILDCDQCFRAGFVQM